VLMGSSKLLIKNLSNQNIKANYLRTCMLARIFSLQITERKMIGTCAKPWPTKE
jgi:hypothetical protein